MKTKFDIDLAKEFSKEAEIVLMSLTPPPQQESSIDEYLDYLHQFSQTTEHLPALALVLSSEHTPLEIILQ